MKSRVTSVYRKTDFYVKQVSQSTIMSLVAFQEYFFYSHSVIHILYSKNILLDENFAQTTYPCITDTQFLEFIMKSIAIEAFTS